MMKTTTLVLAGSLLAGCLVSFPGPSEHAYPCATRGDCASGYSCIQGTCTLGEACQCANGEYCSSGACLPKISSLTTYGADGDDVAAALTFNAGAPILGGTTSGTGIRGRNPASANEGAPYGFAYGMQVEWSGVSTVAGTPATSPVAAVAVKVGTQFFWGGTFTGTMIGAAGSAVTSAGGKDAFVSSGGNLGWTVSLGGSGDEDVRGLVYAPDIDAVCVVGSFQSSSLTVSGTTYANQGGQDGFITCLAAADGSAKFFVTFGGPGADYPNGIAYDPSVPALEVVGGFSQGAVFGSTGWGGTGGVDAFIWYLTTSGAGLGTPYQGLRVLGGGPNDDVAVAVAHDGATDYIVGTFLGATTIVHLDPAPVTHGFVMGYQPTTNLAWTVDLGPVAPRVIVASPSGVVIGGHGGAGLSFGGGVLDLPGATGFVAAYDPQGHARWSRLFTGEVDSVAYGPANAIGVLGTFSGTMTYPGGSKISAGAHDLFLMTLAE